MISSISNPQIRRIRLLRDKARARAKEGVFIAEGKRLVMETPKELLEKLYISESWVEANEIPEGFNEYEIVSDSCMERISDTVTPQGLLAIVRMPKYSLNELMERRPGFLIVLQDIRDPGNLGTIFRTAEAAGASGLILTKETADPFLPKCVRSTMGGLFRMPFVITDNLENTLKELKGYGVTVMVADKGGEDYSRVDYTKDFALVIGNEANGIRESVRALSDKVVTLPMEGKIESLNAGVAMGIISYEAGRMRR